MNDPKGSGETPSGRRSRLAERLRAGDPAAGDAPLALEEVRQLRRGMLAATREPHRGWRPLLVPLACVLAAVGMGLALWLGRGEVGGPRPTPRVAALPSARPLQSRLPTGPVTPVVTARLEADPPTPPVRRISPPRAPRPPRLPPPPPPPELALVFPAEPPTAAPLEEADPPSRQIQFATPGGTRVIWLVPAQPASASGR